LRAERADRTPAAATLGRVLRRAALPTCLALGCAQIFGIDEACVIGEPGCADRAGAEPPCTPGDPGCAPDAGIDGLCSQYCRQISQKCTAAPQYDDARPPECESLCRHFPRAEGESPTGNNLECRLARVTSASGERSDCFAAGRGGDGVCGTNCDAYCSLMQALCPAHLSEFDAGESLADDVAACQSDCSRLSDRGDYDPTLGGEDEFDELVATIQCRLWHLGSAAIEVEQFGTLDNSHCDHAVGARECFPTPE
jgi:hypothetical protein